MHSGPIEFVLSVIFSSRTMSIQIRGADVHSKNYIVGVLNCVWPLCFAEDKSGQSFMSYLSAKVRDSYPGYPCPMLAHQRRTLLGLALSEKGERDFLVTL
jgi:hypothetical protein